MKQRPLLIVLPALLLCAPMAIFAQESSPHRTISMRECVETALRNNIDIAVSRAEREIGALGVPIEEATFLPRFTGDMGTSRSVSPTGFIHNMIPSSSIRFRSETGQSSISTKSTFQVPLTPVA